MDDTDLWKIYDVNKEWIKFADTKSIAFIAIIGVIFNILFTIADKILILNNYNIIKILFVGFVVFLFISLLLSVCCLMPRTSKTDGNVIYYKSIADNFNDEQDYCDTLKSIDNDEFKTQLSSQVYQLAIVANRKYSIVKWALRFFGGGIILFLLFFVRGVF
ncbi:Pycsar system effector family protein [Methanobrevibacter intestini]|uniref:Pycsar system effector family protein n=1 Tax=Methanobrevibacter intestini TaxID=2911853 RepID=UPI003D044EE2